MFDSTRGPAGIGFIRYVCKITKSFFWDLFEASPEFPEAENLGSIPGADILLVQPRPWNRRTWVRSRARALFQSSLVVVAVVVVVVVVAAVVVVVVVVAVVVVVVEVVMVVIVVVVVVVVVVFVFVVVLVA